MKKCGATTLEAKSGYANTAAGELRLLRLLKRARVMADSPRIRVSFLALHALPKGRAENDYVDEMIAAFDEVVRDGLADQVDTFPERGFFTKENAIRFSLEARRRSLPCKVHADELCDLGSSLAFVQLSALSVDHLQHIAGDAVAALADAQTVATMLPATSFFVGIPYANARRLIDAGARVALATDFNPGTAPAMDLQLTHMLAASQLKMSAPEILCASTFNAAGAIGMDREIGALVPGRIGDVLLYETEGAGSSDGQRELQRLILARTPPTRVISQDL
jgi:imidazolonepropionase